MNPQFPCRDAQKITRRYFLGTATRLIGAGMTATHLGGIAVRAAEHTTPVSAVTDVQHSRLAPLILNQRTFSEMPLAAFLRGARKWRFDGVELVFSKLAAEARRGKQSVGDLVSNAIASANQSEHKGSLFKLALCVDLDAAPTPLEAEGRVAEQLAELVRHVPFVECSLAMTVATPADSDHLLKVTKSYVEAVRNTSVISIENPRISSAVDLRRFVYGMKQLPLGTGILVRSREIQIRLDLALQELKYLLSQQPNEIPVNGIRLDVPNSPSARSHANYYKELFRRALTEQAVGVGDDVDVLLRTKDAFIAVESSESIAAVVDEKRDMGSPIFKEMVTALDNDVLIAR